MTDDGDVLWLRGLQVVSTLITSLQQQCCWFAIHKSKDALIHIVITRHRPVKPCFKRVECPKAGIVTLGGYHLTGTYRRCDVPCQVVGTADVSAQHRDDMHAKGVDTDHGRVFVLVINKRGYRPDANAQRTNEHKRIEVVPSLAYICTADYLCLFLGDERLIEQ